MPNGSGQPRFSPEETGFDKLSDEDMGELASAIAQVPVWIKVLYTLFVCALVPIYWMHYGPANFLWFSDIALLTLVAALWLENSLLASMMALAVLVPELAWNVDFLVRLIFRRGTGGMSGYMFDQSRPLLVGGLSFSHFVFPVVLICLLWGLGYGGGAPAWARVL